MKRIIVFTAMVIPSVLISCDLMSLRGSEKLVTSIEISGIAAIEDGTSVLLSVEIQPSDAGNQELNWFSDDESVATVDSEGRVTAQDVGNVTITAESTDGSGVFDDFQMSVTEAADPNPAESIIADHTIMRRIYDAEVPASAIENAKEKLRIGYGHTSHGSQIMDGMSGLVGFVNDNNESGERFAPDGDRYEDGLFALSEGWLEGSDGLQLFEGSGYNPGYLELDCGYSGWEDETREFLSAYYDQEEDDEDGYRYIIMWSWCGQVNGVDLDTHYFQPMEELEAEYPDVVFVYMTGHLEGGPDNPETNSLLAANNRIRDYCSENGKVLFDFADIEKYNLDLEYFGDKNVDDSCDYDGGNWAVEWQNAHDQGIEWYSCGSAHSQPVNSNQKAYAAWWLWARLAGWED